MPGYYNDLLFNITCDDAKWVKDGKKIVFIGEKMAHDLICSKAVVSKASSHLSQKDHVGSWLPQAWLLVVLAESLHHSRNRKSALNIGELSH